MTDAAHLPHDDDEAAGQPRLLTLSLEGPATRVDKFLGDATGPEGLSRSRIKALVLEGALTIDGAACRDPSLKIRPGQTAVLALPEPEAAEPLPEAIPLVIAYEDEDIIVIDKPAGMVVHPAAGHHTGTLVNALLAHCGDSLSGIGGVRRPGIVHRLDKDTSGLIVVAKHDRAHRHLAAQFADHGRTGPLERAYEAFIWGQPARPAGTIDANIERSHANREKMAVAGTGHGRTALTHYTLEEAFAGASGQPLAARVTCELETGRTHQIRLHMAHIGHPLLGDPLYGAGFRTKAVQLPGAARAALDALGRQALHARLLGFEHPRTGETLSFESPLPADMETLLAALRCP